MLHVSHHDSGSVQVELLDGVVCTNGEQACTRAVDGQSLDVLEGGYLIISDMLGPYVPRQSLALRRSA